MSFGFGLGAGMKALTAARLGMQTSGNNISNANTPGYSRQRVLNVSDLPFYASNGQQVGSGVRISNIQRLVDEGVEGRIRAQLAMYGEAEVGQLRFQEMEGIFNEPNGGISAVLGGLFGSISKLQTDPSDRALRGGVVQSGRSLAESFNLTADRLDELSSSSFNEITALIRKVNQNADTIAELNKQIVALESNGSTSNDLRDTREQRIKEISELMETRTVERETGSVDLLIGGHLMVAGDRSSGLTVEKGPAGSTEVTAIRGGAPVTIRGGRIRALLDQEASGVPQYRQRLDVLAQQTILQFNRIHSTGIPGSGPFDNLLGAYGAIDGDGDGTRGDELLNQGGFPFEIGIGELYVAVSADEGGDLTRHRIDIDPRAMSLQDLAAELDSIDNLNASVDPTGRLRISATAGYGFDFSNRLDPTPDTFGGLGGANPAVGTAAKGPFDLSGNTFPASFTVTTGTAASPVASTVTLTTTDFVNPSAVTADEMATAINASLGAAGTAEAVGGRLMLRSNTGGPTSELSVADVPPNTLVADLGLPTSTFTGQDRGVAVNISGSYSGSVNGELTFVPRGDGVIGVDTNLFVDALDQNGRLVASLQVGQGYSPGNPIDVGDGISVSFGPGEIRASANQAFSLDTLADSDTSDVLVALGINSFYHGTSAGTIKINPELAGNADRLAAGLSTASGDADNLARFVELQDLDLAELGGSSIENFYNDVVGDLGFEAAAAETALISQGSLLDALMIQREEISGVNIDEEMVDLTRHQQSYDAAARFISVVQEMTNTLINIGR